MILSFRPHMYFQKELSLLIFWIEKDSISALLVDYVHTLHRLNSSLWCSKSQTPNFLMLDEQSMTFSDPTAQISFENQDFVTSCFRPLPTLFILNQFTLMKTQTTHQTKNSPTIFPFDIDGIFLHSSNSAILQLAIQKLCNNIFPSPPLTSMTKETHSPCQIWMEKPEQYSPKIQQIIIKYSPDKVNTLD